MSNSPAVYVDPMGLQDEETKRIQLETRYIRARQSGNLALQKKIEKEMNDLSQPQQQPDMRQSDPYISLAGPHHAESGGGEFGAWGARLTEEEKKSLRLESLRGSRQIHIDFLKSLHEESLDILETIRLMEELLAKDTITDEDLNKFGVVADTGGLRTDLFHAKPPIVQALINNFEGLTWLNFSQGMAAHFVPLFVGYSGPMYNRYWLGREKVRSEKFLSDYISPKIVEYNERLSEVNRRLEEMGNAYREQKK